MIKDIRGEINLIIDRFFNLSSYEFDDNFLNQYKLTEESLYNKIKKRV